MPSPRARAGFALLAAGLRELGASEVTAVQRGADRFAGMLGRIGGDRRRGLQRDRAGGGRARHRPAVLAGLLGVRGATLHGAYVGAG